ncbi:MAG: metal-dependent hydrolase [bacterium]|nr:metal-dependent hydrolase [bacterium]
MDSVTQFALGAAVGHAVLGRKVGRIALAWGAALGTLPDLDILIPLSDPVASFTWHRSWSHSLFVLAVAAPLFAWLAGRLHPRTREHRRGWLALVLAVLWTHVVLDCFTVYGTQIFWPLPFSPESWSTVFVIDPLYTLPLLIGGMAAFFGRPRWNVAGLVVSSLYLGWSVVAKVQVERLAAAAIARDGIPATAVLTTPAPLQTLLWRVVVMTDAAYYEGYYSFAAAGDRLEFERHPIAAPPAAAIASYPAVARLRWFAAGVGVLARDPANPSSATFTDLRMGSEPNYMFRFVVAEHSSGVWREVTPRRAPSSPSSRDWLNFAARLWARIWDREIDLSKS